MSRSALLARPLTRRLLLGGAGALALGGALASRAVPAPAAPAAARTARLRGLEGHRAAGTVRVAGGRVVFEDDYDMAPAPGAYVAFGSSAAFARGTDFAALRAPTGAQSYAIPPSVNAAVHSAVWIWSRPHAIPLAMGRLT